MSSFYPHSTTNQDQCKYRQHLESLENNPSFMDSLELTRKITFGSEDIVQPMKKQSNIQHTVHEENRKLQVKKFKSLSNQYQINQQLCRDDAHRANNNDFDFDRTLTDRLKKFEEMRQKMQKSSSNQNSFPNHNLFTSQKSNNNNKNDDHLYHDNKYNLDHRRVIKQQSKEEAQRQIQQKQQQEKQRLSENKRIYGNRVNSHSKREDNLRRKQEYPNRTNQKDTHYYQNRNKPISNNNNNNNNIFYSYTQDNHHTPNHNNIQLPHFDTHLSPQTNFCEIQHHNLTFNKITPDIPQIKQNPDFQQFTMPKSLQNMVAHQNKRYQKNYTKQNNLKYQQRQKNVRNNKGYYDQNYYNRNYDNSSSKYVEKKRQYYEGNYKNNGENKYSSNYRFSPHKNTNQEEYNSQRIRINSLDNKFNSKNYLNAHKLKNYPNQQHNNNTQFHPQTKMFQQQQQTNTITKQYQPKNYHKNIYDNQQYHYRSTSYDNKYPYKFNHQYNANSNKYQRQYGQQKQRNQNRRGAKFVFEKEEQNYYNFSPYNKNMGRNYESYSPKVYGEDQTLYFSPLKKIHQKYNKRQSQEYYYEFNHEQNNIKSNNKNNQKIKIFGHSNFEE